MRSPGFRLSNPSGLLGDGAAESVRPNHPCQDELSATAGTQQPPYQDGRSQPVPLHDSPHLPATGSAKLNEEVWMTADGRVTKYNLAYINHLVCQKDNGRVLGYDNSHGVHHRHFMGKVEPYKYQSYGLLAAEFHEQVVDLWRQEDEENA